MTRVIDKRNVCIVVNANSAANSEILLLKRGTDPFQLVYGKHDYNIEIESGGNPVSHLTTPDMIAVVAESYPSGNANVKAYFNGVETPATVLIIGGDTYKLWGLKSQDFVLFDFSGTT